MPKNIRKNIRKNSDAANASTTMPRNVLKLKLISLSNRLLCLRGMTSHRCHYIATIPSIPPLFLSKIVFLSIFFLFFAVKHTNLQISFLDKADRKRGLCELNNIQSERVLSQGKRAKPHVHPAYSTRRSLFRGGLQLSNRLANLDIFLVLYRVELSVFLYLLNHSIQEKI